MDEIKFIFPALEDLVLLSAGCCCEIRVPQGYVWGPKLTIIIEPPEE
jgi:hypothetical protein